MLNQLSLLLALGTGVLCQSNLPTLLDVYTQVNASQSLGFIRNDTEELAAFTNATNKTVFIVPDAAFDHLRTLGYGGYLEDHDFLHANLQYAMVNGVYTTANFSETPLFVHSDLTNTSYTNVTGGAVRKIYKAPDGTSYVYGSNNTNVTIIKSDILFQGGVAHVLSGPNGIPDVISVQAQNLSIASILTANDLGFTGNIEVVPDVTAFAYSNSGFNDLINFFSSSVSLAAAVNSLGIIKQALAYSYINGSVLYTTDIPVGNSGVSVKTEEGSNVTLTKVNGTSYVNGMKIVLSDLLTANGVLHIIDGYLLPPGLIQEFSGSSSTGAEQSMAQPTAPQLSPAPSPQTQSSTVTPTQSTSSGRNDRRGLSTMSTSASTTSSSCQCPVIEYPKVVDPEHTPPDRRDLSTTTSSTSSSCPPCTSTSTYSSPPTPEPIEDADVPEAVVNAEHNPPDRRRMRKRVTCSCPVPGAAAAPAAPPEPVHENPDRRSVDYQFDDCYCLGPITTSSASPTPPSSPSSTPTTAAEVIPAKENPDRRALMH